MLHLSKRSISPCKCSQNAANGVKEILKFKNFLGGMPPDPPSCLAPSALGRNSMTALRALATPLLQLRAKVTLSGGVEVSGAETTPYLG